MAILTAYSPQLIILFLLLGSIPSIVWLLYFLKKDVHPEPRRVILRVFLLGMLSTIPAAYVETVLENQFFRIQLSSVVFLFVYFLLNIALVEELFKYAAARVGALSSRHVDEPVDVMMYMIIAALGFAAFENVLHLVFKVGIVEYPLSLALWVTSLRFIGATFLHALVSGLFGYFIAKGRSKTKAGYAWNFFTGLVIASVLHAAFNFYIVIIERQQALSDQKLLFLLIPSLLLIGLAFVLAIAIWRVKRYAIIRNNLDT